MLERSRFVALLFGLLSLQAQAESCVWFAADGMLVQVSALTNDILRRVRVSAGPHLMAMNATDCGVWIVDKPNGRLHHFDAEGVSDLELALHDIAALRGGAQHLAVDPADGSIWLGDQHQFVHLSPRGETLGFFPVADSIRRVRMALDRSLWVLDNRSLRRIDSNGTTRATIPIEAHLKETARDFVLDDLADRAWLVGQDELVRIKLSEPAEEPWRIQLDRRAIAMALDPLTGILWVAQDRALLAYAPARVISLRIDLASLGIEDKPRSLALDPRRRALWMSTKDEVIRFAESGLLTARIAERATSELLGVPPFQVLPTLDLIRPPLNALTTNPRPAFELAYGARCNGEPCALGSSHLGAFQLDAALNAQSIGGQFKFDSRIGGSSYTPGTALREGTNTFTAQARDRFGQASERIETTITVDTIAPRFVSISPANGSVFQEPRVVVHGLVDDASAQIVLENSAQTGGSSSSPQIGAFSFPVTLQPGPNTVTLSAIDRAGNVATTSLQLTLAVTPISLAIESPANGATLPSDSVLVSGTFQGPANTGVTVNGVIAITEQNRFFATVALSAGSNLIEVVATAPAGAQATQRTTVTRLGAGSISVRARETVVVAPANVSFEITNSTGRRITRLEADFDSDGTIDLATSEPADRFERTYATAGRFSARFSVTDDQGVTHFSVVMIQIAAPEQLDQLLRGVWTSFLGTLGTGNKIGAMSHLTLPAREKYGPVFDALANDLRQIVATFSDPQLVSVSENIGEYAVNRNIDGENRLFLIYLMRDGNGVWRVDSM